MSRENRDNGDNGRTNSGFLKELPRPKPTRHNIHDGDVLPQFRDDLPQLMAAMGGLFISDEKINIPTPRVQRKPSSTTSTSTVTELATSTNVVQPSSNHPTKAKKQMLNSDAPANPQKKVEKPTIPNHTDGSAKRTRSEYEWKPANTTNQDDSQNTQLSILQVPDNTGQQRHISDRYKELRVKRRPEKPSIIAKRARLHPPKSTIVGTQTPPDFSNCPSPECITRFPPTDSPFLVSTGQSSYSIFADLPPELGSLDQPFSKVRFPAPTTNHKLNQVPSPQTFTSTPWS